eukprot:TRINITY_DN68582_c0_g1_i1.p1 TRINITY_DN68582_c0_g1~~TRINITY_DN68582_c0_g1_i1.p1  ORF type:complete len:1006 (-),score=223.59 TRINITY_DN68582_c0_g1_i1:51-3068(-)
MGSAGVEKRGHLTVEASGTLELLVLRRGTLRTFLPLTGKPGGRSDGERACAPIATIHLGSQTRVRLFSGGTALEIKTNAPYDCTYVYREPVKGEAEAWRDALERSTAEVAKQVEGHMQFLSQGCTAYKYNYSNSKRMRRHFWIDEARAELCWGKSRSEEPQTMDLKDSVGIIYGAMTTTFQRCVVLEDSPWCCFSLLFPDRTLDLAVPNDELAERWFFGLQHLLLQRSTGCVSILSEPQFFFRRVLHKLRDSGQRQNPPLSVQRFLGGRLRALHKDTAFRQSLGRLSNGDVGGCKPGARRGSDVHATSSTGSITKEDAAAERRRKRRESKLENGITGSPAPSSEGGSERKPRKSRVSLESARGEISAELQVDEAELTRQIADLELELDAQTIKLDALRPAWEERLGNVVPMDTLGEVLRSCDSVSWQAEKCGELEREELTLRVTHNKHESLLVAAEKAEKLLKKQAKQFKETESQVKALENELRAMQAGAQSSENARFSSSAELERAEAQKLHLERRVAELEKDLQHAQKGQELAASYKEKNKRQTEELARLDRDKAELRKEVDSLTQNVKTVERSNSENERKLQDSAGLSTRLVENLRKLQREVADLSSVQKLIRGDCHTQLRSLADSLPPLNGAAQKIGKSVNHLMERYREIAEERKKLHNLVLELKGNIRVFVRVRPINEREKNSEPPGEATITFAEDSKMSVFEESTSRRKWFDFDRVFAPKTQQQEVFEDVKPLATSVLDGFNVCIFAYGQTGSGKTFTMTGNQENPGLNWRVLKELFRIKAERQLENDIRITLMITEIYNETIQDLLTTKQKKLDVKTNADGSNCVPGLTELDVHTVEEVIKVMTDAQANRTTMETDMNEQSSRSHSIVQVKTLCTVKKDKREFAGKISLIDLAGSENVNKSGVSDVGLREAQNINRSLSALGDVMQALIGKTPHVPYRNSKLTMMLKDSLGGDSKTLMIVQCSPAQGNVTETLSSLKFAARARNVELGKAKRNVKQAE